MPRDRPDAQELIATAAEHLAVNVRPALDGHDAFEALIAANLLAIALRELELGPALRARDEEELSSLLGEGGSLESSLLGAGGSLESSLLGEGGSLEQLEALVAARIRDGELDDRFGEVRSVLRRSALGRVQIANPDYVHKED